MKPVPGSVMRTYLLAKKITRGDTRSGNFFLLGLRVGIAMALWRPGIAGLYLEALKVQLSEYGVSPQELVDLEARFISEIYDTDMGKLPTYVEPN